MSEDSKSCTEVIGKIRTVHVNPKIYPLDVIYSAAYVFLDDFYIILDGDPEKRVIIKLFPKKTSNKDNEDIEKKFHNELVNYAFYKKQGEKNADIRKSIIQRALLTTEFSLEPEIVAPECNDYSYIEDPEGIAIPWEEKFGDKKKKR